MLSSWMLLAAVPPVAFVAFIVALLNNTFDLQRRIVYLNFITLQHYAVSPREYGFTGRRLALDVEDGVTLQGWHLTGLSDDEELAEELFADGDTGAELAKAERVIVYFHGNVGSRALTWRRETYKLLLRQFPGSHIVVYDYRGFADSTGRPSATGLHADSLAIWKWVTKHVPSSRVRVWGHSLGTGVSLSLMNSLHELGAEWPESLVLQSPFFSLAEGAKTYPLFRALTLDLKFLRDLVDSVLIENYHSHAWVKNVSCPLLIVHGDADNVVPVEQGLALAKEAEGGKAPSVNMHVLPGAGHSRGFEQHPLLVPVLKKFWTG